MIYSVFAWMCYYAMFTSCLYWPMCWDDWENYMGKTVDYCNIVHQELLSYDKECFIYCK